MAVVCSLEEMLDKICRSNTEETDVNTFMITWSTFARGYEIVEAFRKKWRLILEDTFDGTEGAEIHENNKK